MNTTPPRFGFPCVQRVQLHSFSLYSRTPNAGLDLEPGVTCLAGANGIGKSTFLCTVNFALTGAVPEPSREFMSAPAYFTKAKDYTSSFFDGRINEADRDNAAVSVFFTVRKRQYLVKRALFSVGAIEELSIWDDGVQVHSSDGATAEQNDELYRKDLCLTIGLDSFEQFVMLQHFLFTFDESRHLVFWDRPASAALLHVCFGGDPHDAALADHLNREMERSGSRGRNYQFQATNLTKRINTLEASVKGTTENSLEGDQAEAQHRALTAAAEKAIVESDEAEALMNEADLKVIAANADVLNRRAAYDKAFERLMLGSSTPNRHPLVTSAITDCRCPVCHGEGPQVATAIHARLEAQQCPLCASAIQAPALDVAASEQLSQLDVALAQAKRALDDTVDAKTRIARTVAIKREAVKSTREAVQAFEESNRSALEIIRGRLALLDGPLAETLEAFRKARQDLTAQRDIAYAERDRFRDDLRVLQRKVEQKYIEAETQFVPQFKALAKAFLGVDLDITLISGGAIGLHLQIEMRGNARRKESQLSESQRFFVDIALRMALAQYVSDPESRAMLFIDTPEGSLDIAYEDRAGQMFGDFVKSGHALLMTANINSSKLLTTLARVCTSRSMALVQMTHWTELSDVQQQASGLFHEAFAEISTALGAGA